jgi:hypothetical protein
MGGPSNVDIQLAAARAFACRGGYQDSFEYLERAHILAQTSTFQHVRVHWPEAATPKLNVRFWRKAAIGKTGLE